MSNVSFIHGSVLSQVPTYLLWLSSKIGVRSLSKTYKEPKVPPWKKKVTLKLKFQASCKHELNQHRICTQSPSSDYSWWLCLPSLFRSHMARYHPHHWQKHSASFPPWWWWFLTGRYKPAGVCSIRSPRGPAERLPPALCCRLQQKVPEGLQKKGTKLNKTIEQTSLHVDATTIWIRWRTE